MDNRDGRTHVMVKFSASCFVTDVNGNWKGGWGSVWTPASVFSFKGTVLQGLKICSKKLALRGGK